MRQAALLLAAIPVLLAPAAHADPETARQEGAALYTELCSECHALNGAGGRYGPDLIGARTRSFSHDELRRVIGRGRQDAGMPGFERDVGARRVALLLAHVRRLQGVTESEIPPPDDTAQGPTLAVVRGEAVFRRPGRCLECHAIFDEGGPLGPDLTDVATRLSAEAIQEAVLEPSKSIAPGFRAATIVTLDGRSLHGRIRRAGGATLQIFDPEELLWTTHFKNELRSVEWSDESLMPDEAETLLDADQLGDLLSFLASLE